MRYTIEQINYINQFVVPYAMNKATELPPTDLFEKDELEKIASDLFKTITENI